MTNDTVFVLWECKNCGRLHADPLARHDRTDAPPSTKCVHRTKKNALCEYECLDHFGSVDLTAEPPSPAAQTEMLRTCDFWNGQCKSDCLMMERGHCRFQCGSVMDTVEDDAAAEEIDDEGSRKGVGAVAIVGTWLALWGVMVAAAGVLRKSFCESAWLETRWAIRRTALSEY